VPVFVAQEHSWAFAGDRLRVFVDRHLVGTRADAIVAVSEHDRRAMIEVERLDADRIVVCGNGVAPVSSNGKGKLRAELGLSPAAPVIGLVGGLRPEKRVDVLIAAAARLRAELPELVTVVIGEGPERPRLEELVARLGLRDRVRFLGHRDDAVELAAGFDVAVLTSEREGCPLALLEYMSLGRPIVATRVGGIPSLVHDGIEALLVQEGNADAVASAVGLLLRNRLRASLLGAAAARRQAAEFGLDTAVGRLERLYERLLAARCSA
jgi:L-malate glycosyltransferase